MRFCTVIASNYLAYARVLGASIREHHPECGFTVLVIDPEPVELRATDDFDVLGPADIGLTGEEFRHMAVIYDLMELATAVKATLLIHLLDTCGEPVCYLDPDIELFDRLDGVDAVARRHGMVLTPHTTTPLPRDGKFISEQTLLLAGRYNLGFIAVAEGGRPFLEWWKERMRRDCRVAFGEGIFVDQRWVDFASTCFDHFVVSDPCFNVAYWNLHGRSLTQSPDGWLVDGRPLRFFHFSGFSPLRPHLLSKHQGGVPRIRLSEHPPLARLCAQYGEELLGAGYLAWAARPYRFDYTARGIPLDARMRAIYRSALTEAESENASPCLPDPFDPTTAEDFLDWMCLPGGPSGLDRIPRYLRRIHDERIDLQVHFPELAGPKGDDYLEFMRVYGQSSADIPPWCARGTDAKPEWPPSPVAGRADHPGVNVVGYLDAENGVGEVARLLIDALRHAAIPYAALSWDQTPARRSTSVYRSARLPEYDVSVVCVNADQIQRLPGSAVVIPNVSRTIGIWAWEVSTAPAWMRRSAALVDEIWTYSRHSADAIAALVDVPVHVFAPPILSSPVPDTDRNALGLPPGFLFLFCLDYFSVFERKNPLAVVEAFSRAFGPGEGPQLVIKTVNAESFPVQAARLQAAADARPDITIVDGYATRDHQAALMASCDAYVSLHRAEGYGLTLAEAMAMGKPTVATGYSGNLEFMNADNSRLVPYEMSSIPLGCTPYPFGAEWAEPDVDVAAGMLRELAGDPGGAACLGHRARGDVLAHGPATRAGFLRERLLAVGAYGS